MNTFLACMVAAALAMLAGCNAAPSNPAGRAQARNSKGQGGPEAAPLLSVETASPATPGLGRAATSNAPAPTALSPVTAPTAITATDDATMLAATDRRFILDAQQLMQAELEASTVALARSQSPALRRLAEQVANQRERQLAELRALAQSKNLALPLSDPAAPEPVDLRLLKSLHGSTFDQRYVRELARSEQRLYASAFGPEARQGQDADLKQFASSRLSAIERQLQDTEVTLKATAAKDG